MTIKVDEEEAKGDEQPQNQIIEIAKRKKPRTIEDNVASLKKHGYENIILKPILDYDKKLMRGQMTVKQIMAADEFIVYHEGIRQELQIKAIDIFEDITKWLDLPSHSNIVTAFDQFSHFADDDESYVKNRFTITEKSNLGL